MPHDDADSGDEESDSDYDPADFARFEDFKISEEERQAAIDRVTFEQCELVRAVGERYRNGDSIPVIPAESGNPMVTVRKAVKTYYLIFAEPPIGEVSTQKFRDGRRYFVDGDDVAALGAETQTEAEKHVRAFVGRTLLDNDLDTVDIEEPVPEVPATNGTTQILRKSIRRASPGDVAPHMERTHCGRSRSTGSKDSTLYVGGIAPDHVRAGGVWRESVPLP